jgi:hypothetical protein
MRSAARVEGRLISQRQPPLRTPVGELDVLDGPAFRDPPDAVGKVREPCRSQLRPAVVLFVWTEEQPSDRLLRRLIEVAQYPGHDEEEKAGGIAGERRPCLVLR